MTGRKPVAATNPQGIAGTSSVGRKRPRRTLCPMPSDDALAAAKQELDAARRILESGRDGASKEWLAAAESFVRVAEKAYRRAQQAAITVATDR
jgi:hypothetical protein